MPDPSNEVKQILARFLEVCIESKGDAARRHAASILGDEDGAASTQRKDDERARTGYESFQSFVHFVILTTWQFPGSVYRTAQVAIQAGSLSPIFKKLSTGK
jgi:hypothetical protein